MRTRSRRGLALMAVAALAASTVPAMASASAQTAPRAAGQPGWRLAYAEDFGRTTPVDGAPWVRDPHGDKSPWNVDHLDDDGKFYDIQGGAEFRRQLNSFDVLRKRVPFGKDGWLTAELGARDADKDGRPESPPTLGRVKVNGNPSGKINEPSHDSGIILRNTRPLPSRYRVEYTLRTIDFGGRRNGTWDYAGKKNGYAPEGCKTNWPWKASGDFGGQADRCNPDFGDTRNANGYYFLAIMDYANPAPHNNVFIHNHRKVGMDAYNTNAPWASSYQVCNPATRKTYPYIGPDGTNNAINEIFFDGSRFKDPKIGYNEFLMATECGTKDGADPKATIVSAAEIRPELMPRESYRFAIERNAGGYTMEMSGNFLHAGHRTLRYHRKFVEADGRPIWHYNQKPGEYDGTFDKPLTFTGPNGAYTVNQWPKGSAYPDYFILGDPHMNFYEGSATVDDIKLYVPRG